MTEAPHGPVILTATLDPASQARFERERQRHFPSSLNIVPAHVTLFHHLPPEHDAEVGRALDALAAEQPQVAFHTTGLRFLGRGSAYALHMPEMDALRAVLAGKWRPWLTAQDRQPWQAHVTVQNKAAPAEAKHLHAALMAAFVPHQGMVVGVARWEYCAGPWRLLQHHSFSGGA